MRSWLPLSRVPCTGLGAFRCEFIYLTLLLKDAHLACRGGVVFSTTYHCPQSGRANARRCYTVISVQESYHLPHFGLLCEGESPRMATWQTPYFQGSSNSLTRCTLVSKRKIRQFTFDLFLRSPSAQPSLRGSDANALELSNHTRVLYSRKTRTTRLWNADYVLPKTGSMPELVLTNTMLYSGRRQYICGRGTMMGR